MDVYVICENDNGRLIDLEVYFSEQSAEEALGEYKDKQDGRIYVIKNENAMSDEDINVFKSLGYSVEEKRNDPNFGSVQGVIYNKNDKTVEIGQDVGNR